MQELQEKEARGWRAYISWLRSRLQRALHVLTPDAVNLPNSEGRISARRREAMTASSSWSEGSGDSPNTMKSKGKRRFNLNRTAEMSNKEILVAKLQFRIRKSH